MGEFSFLKADRLTQTANIVQNRPFKFLVPEEFGGGAIKATYQGYGKLFPAGDKSHAYDMYELVAFWNADQLVTTNFVHQATISPIWKEMPFDWLGKKPLKDMLRFDGEELPVMKCMDHNTNFNRSIGIELYSTEQNIAKLRYPLKLVSASYSGTYEDCPGVSIWDPWQGLRTLWRTQELSRWVSDDFVRLAERALSGCLKLTSD